MADDYTRLREALKRADDLSLSRITVGDLRTLMQIWQDDAQYPPMWEDECKQAADQVEQILAAAAGGANAGPVA